MTGTDDPSVGQVLYCWTTKGLSGTHGFGFRAVSADLTRQELDALEPECSSFRPAPGTRRTLSRLLLPSGRVAVIHKGATGHADGRHVAHALLAQPHDLEAFLASTLWTSPIWRSDESGLDPTSTDMPQLEVGEVAGLAGRLDRPDLDNVAAALAESAAGDEAVVGGPVDHAVSTVGFSAFALPVGEAAHLCFTVGRTQPSGVGAMWFASGQSPDLPSADVVAMVRTAGRDTSEWQALRSNRLVDLDYLATIAAVRSDDATASRVRIWERGSNPSWAGVLLGEDPVALAFVEALARETPPRQRSLLNWARRVQPSPIIDDGAVEGRLRLAGAAVTAFKRGSVVPALAALYGLVAVTGHDDSVIASSLTAAGAAPWMLGVASVLLGSPRNELALAGIPPAVFLDLAETDPRFARPEVTRDVVSANLDEFAELALDGSGGSRLLSEVLAASDGPRVALRGLSSGRLTWLQLEEAVASMPGSAELLRACLSSIEPSDRRWLRDHDTILDAIRPFIADLPALEAVLEPFLWDEKVQAGAIERWRRRGDQARLERELKRQQDHS